jgi:hypothetical protein
MFACCPFGQRQAAVLDKQQLQLAAAIRPTRRHTAPTIPSSPPAVLRGGDDPRALLRAINPREAALLDAAAGAHVRFRLGGASFPPQVLYKIFTHRPVAGGLLLCNGATSSALPPAAP